MTVVLGRPNVAESADGIVAAASAIHVTHPEVRFLSALRRANVHGALDMGLAPGLLPGRTTLEAGAGWFRDRAGPGCPPHGASTPPGSSRRPPRDGSTCSCSWAPIRWPTSPISTWPRVALAGARTVIAVDRFLTESGQHADVVLAAAGPAEVDGTTTNIEGRVSTVTQKITPPGTARDDWMLAAELSRLLGTDLGLESAAQILEEIAAIAPSHAGLTLARLHAEGGRDGLLPGAAPDPVESSAPSSEVDPDAGEAAVAAAAADTDEERQAAEAEATRAQADAETPPTAEPEIPRPAPVAFDVSVTSEAPAVDAYSLRLVATRKLYDLGTDVQHARGAGRTHARRPPCGSIRTTSIASASTRAPSSR